MSKKTMLWIGLGIALAALVFYGAIYAVAVHFIVKFW